ncbi:ribonuclease H-like domain-containing protein [Tanacetum coccineum]
MNVSPIPTTRIHKDHPKDQIIGDLNSATQTRRMTKISEELAMVYRNKKDKRRIVVRNKARLVAQGYTQEEDIDYDEVFAPVARIEAIMLYLAYASFMGFIVYQMNVKSAFLYGTIEEEVMQRDDGIFISQDKYVDDILKKFDFVIIKTACTLIETNKALRKDEEAREVDVHLYISMIGSLMYLIASRPDIMFAVCACARDSPFDLEAFLDSDYSGASLDRKSATRDETVIKEWEDRMERAATTASSLEAEQDSGNINRTQSMATLNESFPQGADSGSGPRCQDTILGGAEAQTREQADTSLVRQNEGNHTETSIRSDLSWFDAEGTDCLPTATSFAKLERMGKNNKRLSKPQKKKSKRKQRKDSGPTEPIPDEAINEEHVATPSYDPPQSELDKKSKEFGKRRKSRTPGFKRLRKIGSASRVESSNYVSLGAQEDASKQGRKIADLDADAEVTLVDETQEINDDNLMFDKEMKRVNTFVDMNTELVKSSETRTEGSSKRARDELESDNSKKKKIDEHVEAKKDDDQEEAEMKKHIEIVKDDEIDLWKPLELVKAKHGITRPDDEYDEECYGVI